MQDFVSVMASALPSVQSSANSGSGVRWNTLQLSAAGAGAASRAQDLALWHMQARHYRCVCVCGGCVCVVYSEGREGGGGGAGCLW